jgi:chemotaxis family two-component system sensor kinase Cph1
MGNATIFKEKLVLLYRYTVIAIVCWILIIVASLIWNIHQGHKSIESMAINEALSSFKRDEAFRLFIASRGGVYVPLDDKTPSNPYLHHPERDITTTSGKKLTLMNGAYFFHKVMEEYGHVTGVKWRLTSLKPTNPANTPDEWEQKTLRALEQQAKMMFGFNDIKGEPYLRLLSPLVTVESCLKCHGYQGYNIGDIRGAMGVFLPMAPYLVQQRRVTRDLIWTHGILALLGLFGIGFASMKIRNRFLENIRAEEELEKHRDHLEELVKEQTRELTEANLHLTEENAERKRTEESLRDTGNLMQVVLDSIPSAVFWKDCDSIYLGGNRIWLEAVGLKSSEEVVGKSDYDLPWEKKQADLFREDDKRVMESGIPEHNIIEPYRQADGTQAWAKTNKVPLRDTVGKVIGILGTYEDITERKRAEEALRQLNIELEDRVLQRTAQLTAANAELEAFSYSVSHDLRAPLRAISGFTQIIGRRHRADLNEEGQHYVDNIIQGSERMGQLIDDLLTYSRIGRSAIHAHSVPLGDVLTPITLELSGRVKDIGAELTIADDLPTVYGDSTLLTQIFHNLFDNALNYRRPDVLLRVKVDAKSEGDQVVIRIADNGIGIPHEYHQKIFNVFQRLHSEDEYPGTGIGLSIVKKSVTMLGGDVWVESVVGEGSVFYVRLKKGETV